MARALDHLRDAKETRQVKSSNSSRGDDGKEFSFLLFLLLQESWEFPCYLCRTSIEWISGRPRTPHTGCFRDQQQQIPCWEHSRHPSPSTPGNPCRSSSSRASSVLLVSLSLSLWVLSFFFFFFFLFLPWNPPLIHQLLLLLHIRAQITLDFSLSFVLCPSATSSTYPVLTVNHVVWAFFEFIQIHDPCCCGCY